LPTRRTVKRALHPRNLEPVGLRTTCDQRIVYATIEKRLKGVKSD